MGRSTPAFRASSGPPGTRCEYDHVRVDGPGVGLDPHHSAVACANAGDPAPESCVYATSDSGREPAEHHLLRIGETAVRLVRAGGDPIE